MRAAVRWALSLALFGMGLMPSSSRGNDPEAYTVVHGWPEMPPGFVLGEAAGVGVDSHNHVFVFHRGSRRPVMMFDGKTGRLLGAWGDGLFSNPHGLAIDDEDHVWLTDGGPGSGHHQVFEFSHDGELLMTIGKKGVPGWDGSHFNGPTDVVVAPDGTFYVADGYGNRRIARFARDGRFLDEWGGEGDLPGQFALPHGIARDKDGRLYVADRSNARIQVFDADGTFLDQWRLPDNGRPWGLEVGADGYLYVIDGGDLKPEPPDRGQVVKMDLEGNVITTFGRFGLYDGQFYWGHDIAVGKDGAVYVVDVNIGRRVQKFVPQTK